MKNKISFDKRCPICNGEVATDMCGREWCPKCAGKQMADRASRKLKLDLKLK